MFQITTLDISRYLNNKTSECTGTTAQKNGSILLQDNQKFESYKSVLPMLNFNLKRESNPVETKS